MPSNYSNKRPRNPSPPPGGRQARSRNRHTDFESSSSSSRKIRNVTSNADHAELEKHYTFVLSPTAATASGEKQTNDTCWQERMVKHYHSHLYKEYVLADMTRAPAQLGLRWRTKQEVQSGRGHSTCGNKHCPSYGNANGSNPLSSSSEAEATARRLVSNYFKKSNNSGSPPTTNDEEEAIMQSVPYGLGLNDYEVPFTYKERGETKTELVKLRLCLRCSPRLFKGGSLEARRARNKHAIETNTHHNKAEPSRNEPEEQNEGDGATDSSDEKHGDGRKRNRSVEDDDGSEEHRRHRRRSHKRKKRKKKHHIR